MVVGAVGPYCHGYAVPLSRADEMRWSRRRGRGGRDYGGYRQVWNDGGRVRGGGDFSGNLCGMSALLGLFHKNICFHTNYTFARSLNVASVIFYESSQFSFPNSRGGFLKNCCKIKQYNIIHYL